MSNWQDKFGGDGKTPTEPTSAQSAPADTGVDTLTSNDPAQVWQQVQGKLRAVLGERVHMSWTGQLTLQSADETHVVLSAPSKFVVGRIDGKYGDLVRKLWAECDTRNVEIGSGVPKPQMKSQIQQTASQITPQTMPSPHTRITQTGQVHGQNHPQSQLQNKDRFTFENFVVGAPNELAFAVARRVAGSLDSQYNPIIIHGPHGMGKTHLLHAVKAEAAKTNPSRRVHLISAENFVATFVQSVRAQGRAEIDAFKSSLRDVDLLIIDDAHFIADKPGSQEELMHTLISLVDSGKQILLACDRHPQAINKASDRLKSYLCGGLLCDIGAADYELRLRILDRLIERRRAGGHPALAMPSDARDHLAARINATPRDLEGAFNQVVARLEFLGKPLTLESIQEALAHSRYTGQVRPSVDKIQRATAKQFGISMEEMLSKRRARAIARPRQVAMYLAKMLTTRSLPDIGRRFGGRDHTTVIHAVKRIDQLRAEDSGLNSNIETLLEIFNS